MSTEEATTAGTTDTEKETGPITATSRPSTLPQPTSSKHSTIKKSTQAIAATGKASQQTLNPDPVVPLDPLDVPRKNTYDPTALEFQSKIIKGHTSNTSLYFGKFCSGFAAYGRTLAALRDQGDLLARCIAQFSETQAHSPLTKKQLTEYSGFLAAVQDHMHARVLRIEAKVVGGFAKYGTMCHTIKEEVQKGVQIRDKEQKFQEQLQRMNSKSPGDANDQARQHKKDSAAVAALDAQRAHDVLLREADKFEQTRLEDVRRLLMNFCEIELAFHTRAVRLYTHAYNAAKKLDMGEDIASFRTQMNILRGSSSVGPDPNLILESSKRGCVPSDSGEDGQAMEGELTDVMDPLTAVMMPVSKSSFAPACQLDHLDDEDDDDTSSTVSAEQSPAVQKRRTSVAAENSQVQKKSMTLPNRPKSFSSKTIKAQDSRSPRSLGYVPSKTRHSLLTDLPNQERRAFTAGGALQSGKKSGCGKKRCKMHSHVDEYDLMLEQLASSDV
ncbi:hypothetical protein RvY_03321 [Ramazzottius varieornatus]|uniref:BAR domain-containing protein n=1 Tax=Ramazzottius varieornatus TaxID=947166 RepID=A0A1D1UR35_RAMVA|nr:hypothetical protein RvY_03321 [Ramazzottius varieornatus]